MLKLDKVSIVGIEGNDRNTERTLKAIHHSCRYIDFAGKQFITAEPNIKYNDVNIVRIPKMDFHGYGKFMLGHLPTYLLDYNYKHTHTLFVQYDGYVLNPEAWSDEFLKYDYIGARWFWYKDKYTCGNGGFSLRSHKLILAVQAIYHANRLEIDKHINSGEDSIICRIMRPSLEEHFGMVFPPDEIADAFSCENRQYSGQFGWHGKNMVPPNVEIFQ